MLKYIMYLAERQCPYIICKHIGVLGLNSYCYTLAWLPHVSILLWPCLCELIIRFQFLLVSIAMLKFTAYLAER